MRKALFGLAVIVTALALSAAAASASGGGSWYHHTLGNGHAVCNQDSSSHPNPVDGGPFATKAECEAFTPGGGDGGGGSGGDGGGTGGSGSAAAAARSVPQTNDMFLCYSKVGHPTAETFTIAEAIKVLADPSIIAWQTAFLPNAIFGMSPNLATNAQIGSYYLMCNAPGTATGGYLGNDQKGAEVVSAAQAALATASGSPEWYPIVK